MQQETFDVLILGAGPGGYVAAIRAAQLGLTAAVIEKDKPGGVCLNVGCIPSKSLIHQAEIFKARGGLEAMGVKVDIAGFQWAKVVEKSRTAAETLSRGVAGLLKKNNVTVIAGEGRLSSPGEISMPGGKKLKAKNIIIATGSRPRAIPGFDFDEKQVLSSTGALVSTTLPKRLLILGAGAIGCEFAHIMNAFGVEVTLVEMLPQILPAEDPEIVSHLDRSFRARGIRILTSTKALSMQKAPTGIEVSLDTGGAGQTLTVDRLLVVVGRVPNTDAIGLEKVGIVPEKGFVPVGDWYATKVPGLYAIGDVVASPLLAHVASAEGETVVEHLAGLPVPPKLDPMAIPMAVYTEPQVASFGLSEAAAAAAKVSFAKASFPFRGVGKAVAVEAAEGIVKVIFDPASKEILGAQVVGPGATELIHELLLAKQAELFPADVTAMVHAHPTLSESVLEVMRAVEGHAIHI